MGYGDPAPKPVERHQAIRCVPDPCVAREATDLAVAVDVAALARADVGSRDRVSANLPYACGDGVAVVLGIPARYLVGVADGLGEALLVGRQDRVAALVHDRQLCDRPLAGNG